MTLTRRHIPATVKRIDCGGFVSIVGGLRRRGGRLLLRLTLAGAADKARKRHPLRGRLAYRRRLVIERSAAGAVKRLTLAGAA